MKDLGVQGFWVQNCGAAFQRAEFGGAGLKGAGLGVRALRDAGFKGSGSRV